MRGLIPAHAGKTEDAPMLTSCARAHPRSRGENQHVEPYLPSTWGSSPLTRGKLLWRDYRRHVRGLIPAHAGKTAISCSMLGSMWAHPRSRGENSLDTQGNRAALGSSPLTRGKRRRTRSSESLSGLIPAHAGKTMPARTPLAKIPAHPRSRGEN